MSGEAPMPTKAPKGRKTRRRAALVLVVVLAGLYLVATLLCLRLFGGLNPLRCVVGLYAIGGGQAPYVQVAAWPDVVYLARPGEQSNEALLLLMRQRGYREGERMGGLWVFVDENSTLLVTVQGNEHYTRWVFDGPVPLAETPEAPTL